MPLAVFRKHEEKLSLVMSMKTRFGSNFLMVDRLLQVRTALEQSVMDSWIHSGRGTYPNSEIAVQRRHVAYQRK
jgi:hypothetical protein